MNWVSISIMLLSLLQIYTLTKLKWRFISIIVIVVIRSLFLLRIQGIIFKIKPLAIAEGLVLLLQFVCGMVHPEKYNWVFFVLFIINGLISIAIEIIDDKFYIYKVEDVEEE